MGNHYLKSHRKLPYVNEIMFKHVTKIKVHFNIMFLMLKYIKCIKLRLVLNRSKRSL